MVDSIMVDSISIEPEEKTARIKLSSKYLEMKKFSAPEGTDNFLSDTSGREDLNLRHPAPKAGALPDCATPRILELHDNNGFESITSRTGKRRHGF